MNGNPSNFDNQENTKQLPVNFPSPCFDFGTKVQWQTTSADRGLVLGMRYLWAEHFTDWQWQYYVALDQDSPSRRWTEFDWAWQDDLSVQSFDSSPTNLDTSDDQ